MSRSIVVIIAALALVGCAGFERNAELPDRIVFERGGLIPEGIEFDTVSRTLLGGSLVVGTVYRIGADGSLAAFIVDDELVSSVGIEADEARDRLLVANADRSVFGGEGPGIAKLGAYRLSTGAKLAMVDLAPVSGAGDDDIVFTNDVTVAADGSAYVTDTFMNQIYRVDPSYEASLFYRFEPMTGLGLNGIVYHDDGYLIVVASSGEGLLFKVPIDAPDDARPIVLSQPAIGADGLLLTDDGRLIVVSNSTSSATAYASDDGWQTAALVGTGRFEGQATTGAIVGDSIYVVQPHFGDDEPPVILRVDL